MGPGVKRYALDMQSDTHTVARRRAPVAVERQCHVQACLEPLIRPWQKDHPGPVVSSRCSRQSRFYSHCPQPRRTSQVRPHLQ